MTTNTAQTREEQADEIIVTARHVAAMDEMFWRNQDPAIIWTGKTVRVVTGEWLDRYGDRFPELMYIAGADEYVDMGWEDHDHDMLADTITLFAGDQLAERARG